MCRRTLVCATEEWDSVRYVCGEEVAVSFDVIVANVDQNVLATLNADEMNL